MESDQTHNNGSSAWSFPSPGPTPTNSSFDASVFQTPKTLGYPSHFQDAFNTPQLPGYATPQQSELDASFQTLQRSFMPAETLRSNAYVDGQTLPTGHIGGPCLTQSVGMAYPLPEGHVLPSNAGPVGLPMGFEGAPMQMQTPPPTRDASAKRMAAGQPVAFGTPSAFAARKFVTPQQGFDQPQTSGMMSAGPIQFPHLQFSPDVYQFGNFGPATAPAGSQGNFLWGSASSPSHAYSTAALADPFAPMPTSQMWPGADVAPSMSFNTPAMTAFPLLSSQTRPVSVVPIVPSSVSPPSTSAGVNPSLVYSSPTYSSAEPVRPTSKTSQSESPLSQSNQEQACQSTTSARATRIPLRRAHTTGAVKSLSAFTLTSSPVEIPRTVSPLKRVGKPRTSISDSRKARPRSSIILTIDDSGRARTETRPRDDSPTRSAREKYPGLFDSDSSDAGSDSEDEASSRKPSFSFSRSESRRSKAARLEPPADNLDDSTMGRSSSASSSSDRISPSRAAIAAVAQLRRGSSVRRKSSARGLAKRGGNFTLDSSAREGSFDSQAPRLFCEASQELTLEDHNRRWSMMSLGDLQASSSFSQHQLPTSFLGHPFSAPPVMP